MRTKARGSRRLTGGKRRKAMILAAALLIAPTVFLMGCKTAEAIGAGRSAALPERYNELKVTFRDKPEEGGLLLLYDEYRKLEWNVMNMRDYERQLEQIIINHNMGVE